MWLKMQRETKRSVRMDPPVSALLVCLAICASGCQYLVPGRAGMTICTEPPGARVFLNGKELRRPSPIDHEVVWIPPFTDDRVIRLEFVKDGYQRTVLWRRVFWSTLYPEFVTLSPPGTTAFLKEQEPGEWCEQALVDGRPSTRKSNGVGWMLAPGEHEIQVRNGYEFRLRVARGRFTLPPETQFVWNMRDVEDGRVDAIRDLVVRDETPVRTDKEDREVEERVKAAILNHPRFSSCAVRVEARNGIVRCEATFHLRPHEGGEPGQLRAFLSDVPGVAFVNDYSDFQWDLPETAAEGSAPSRK